ncbi:MAG: nuclear transport factor 2 family protein [Flavobacteriaceae bacterium]
MTVQTIADHFYTAFAKGDAETMTSLYADTITFEDPVFGKLKGMEAKMMWHMLIERSKGNLKIRHKLLETTENKVKVKWKAVYPFSKTGRIVKNKIIATMVIENGKIIKHKDHFNLWKWYRQSLGWKGFLLGWIPAVQSKIRTQSRALLYSYLAKK